MRSGDQCCSSVLNSHAENGAALDPESISRYWRQAVKKSMLP
jgi:hypothetical protein